MFRKINTLAISSFVASFALAGCMADGESKVVEPTPPPPTTKPPPTMNPPTGDVVVASTKSRLRFKGGERYAEALANALRLPRSEVCQELGQYDCVTEVHNVALGGVAPYRGGIVEPLNATTITTPIAADRIALAACVERAKRDFVDLDTAVVFTALEVTDGALTDVDAASVERTIQDLYQRLLQRDSEEAEVAALRDLYRALEAEGSPKLAETWSALSCFAVATTTEALFY